MEIGLLSANKYLKNSKPVQKVSFGEFDGDDYYCCPRMTKIQYEARKAAINDKYDDKRSSYLSNADDLGFSNSVVWQQLGKIEQMRDRELAQLEADYNY